MKRIELRLALPLMIRLTACAETASSISFSPCMSTGIPAQCGLLPAYENRETHKGKIISIKEKFHEH
jgi:hypothetical protein